MSASAAAAPSSAVPERATDAAATDDADRLLPIPARSHADGAPPEGWCGETAIQEALLHHGVWAPQAVINRAGSPAHPDLYSNELPRALDQMGAVYTRYVARRGGYADYEAWVKEALDAGDPVIAGVKILPTAHPEWGLDHFVLVVGHGARGLLVNTTWGSREWTSPARTRGISLVNAGYAIRVTGARRPEGATAARASVIREGAAEVRLAVTCVEGGEREVLRATGRGPYAPSGVTRGAPIEITVPREDTARFSCRPVTPPGARP